MGNFACKGHPRNDLYCVWRDVKPYSLTHSLIVSDTGDRYHVHLVLRSFVYGI